MALTSLSMYLFSLLLATNIFAIMADYDPDKVYTIRTIYPRYGDFAVDTRDPSNVQLQEYRQRRAYELFHIQNSARPGQYYITSEPTGEFLDVDKSSYPYTVVLTSQNGLPSQRWYLEDDGRIVNAAEKLVLAIEGNRFEIGNPLIVQVDQQYTNPESQTFKIQEEHL